LHPRLFGVEALIEERVVYVVEGEKSVEVLNNHGLAATCGPYGVTRWLSSWSEDLWRAGCHLAIVLSDADDPGRSRRCNACVRMY
jgi:hypothetical protein